MSLRSALKFPRAAISSGMQATPQRQKTSAIGEISPTASRPATELPPHISAVRPSSSRGEFHSRSKSEGRARASALVMERISLLSAKRRACRERVDHSAYNLSERRGNLAARAAWPSCAWRGAGEAHRALRRSLKTSAAPETGAAKAKRRALRGQYLVTIGAGA